MTTTDPLFGMFLALASSGQQVSPLVQLIPFALVNVFITAVVLSVTKGS